MPERALKAGYFSLFFDLSRSYQSLLSLSQPLLGAIIALRGLPDLRVLILGSIAAIAGYLAVFSLNDVLDRKIDKESLKEGKAERDKHDIGVAAFKHPLAHGDLSLVAALIWVISMGSISSFFAYLLNPLCLWLFFGCVVLEIAYCSMRTASWVKTIPTGAMVALGGLAGWAAVAPLTKGSIYFFLFLALWEIAGRNLSNDLADVDSDRKVGLKTVATVFGNRVSSVAILIGAWVTVALTVTLPISTIPKLAELGISIWLMGAPAIVLARTPSSVQASSYFNKASLFPAIALVILLPFILIGSL
ncbi:MAG TPA: UbiA prenyltransferase family protein [Anaerolineae bacterium]|jgi:4-hydroxybenzoate polyprenyltransferase|nr:UbiA prenyltransferase family protein [Anaerolineae bacterium]